MLVYKAYIAAEFEGLNPLYNLDDVRTNGYADYLDPLIFVDELVEPTDENGLVLCREQPLTAQIVDDRLYTYHLKVYVKDDDEEPPVYMYVTAAEFHDL